MDECKPLVTGCTFDGNVAKSGNGGGMAVASMGSVGRCRLTLSNPR